MTSWELKKLSDVCEVIMGQSPPGNTYNKNGTGLPFFQGKTDFGSFYPTPSTWCTKPKKIAEPNDILISVRAPVGPTNMCNLRCCIGRGLTAIRTKDKINPKFVLYYLRSVEADITSMGTGSTFQAISKSQIANLEIPLAPVPVQKLIVSEIEKQFSRLDEAVAALKRIKANLKRYKASVLKAAVEGKLTEEWRKQNPDVEPAEKLLKRILAERKKKWEEDYRRKHVGAIHELPLRDDSWKKKYKEPSAPDTSNLPELPKGWVWATIGQLAVKVQYGSSAKTNENPSGVPVLRMGNIFENRLKLEGLKYLPKSHSEFPDLILEKEDLLFNRTNSPELVGKTAVYMGNPNPCSFASYLIRVQFNKGANSHFVNFFINSAYGRNWIKTVVSQQVGQANVNGTKLQALSIPLPSDKEQQKIVEEIESRLSVTEEIEAVIGINLKRAEHLRQAILKKAFWGHLINTDQNGNKMRVRTTFQRSIQGEQNEDKVTTHQRFQAIHKSKS